MLWYWLCSFIKINYVIMIFFDKNKYGINIKLYFMNMILVKLLLFYMEKISVLLIEK